MKNPVQVSLLDVAMVEWWRGISAAVWVFEVQMLNAGLASTSCTQIRRNIRLNVQILSPLLTSL